MRKTIFFIFGLLSLFCRGWAQLDIRQADSMMQAYLSEEVDSGYCLYIYEEDLTRQLSVPMVDDTFAVQNAFVYFVDEHPLANWSHPCRLVCIDENGTLKDRKGCWPPDNLREWKRLSASFERPAGKLFDFSDMMRQKKASAVDMSHWHAVILSGGTSTSMNGERFWNDCSAVYSLLVHQYGYLPQNIHVLMSDGTNPDKDRTRLDGSRDSSPLDLDGNGTSDIRYAATKANVSHVFNILAATLTPEDNMFFFVTGHGSLSGPNTQCIDLWGNERMSEEEIKAEFDKLDIGLANILLAQCYSGGIGVALQGDGRVIATACNPLQQSYSTEDQAYEEFVYQWVAAVTGRYPSGGFANADADGNGLVSMYEAFWFAQENDRVLDENPCYYEGHPGLGQEMTLRGLEVCKEIHVGGNTEKNRKIWGCDIEVDNCFIKKNAKLTLDYRNSVTIEKLDMETGTELEIK